MIAEDTVPRLNPEQLLEIVPKAAFESDSPEIEAPPVVGHDRQADRRGRQSRFALSDQGFLPGKPLQLPGTEPEQDQEACENKSRGQKSLHDLDARGDAGDMRCA
jgi:hypothetical protein